MHGCLNCTEHLSLDIALLNSSLTAIHCLHQLSLASVTHKWWLALACTGTLECTLTQVLVKMEVSARSTLATDSAHARICH